ncbi:MAG: hypothetical protein HOQ03_12035 [Thermoleophilia bacterium]|nr:hypothetical protein [Thermoleophilia bacterium]
MSSEKPPWRKAIEDYERAVGAPLEEFIKSDQFADMAAKAAKQQAQAQQGLASSPLPGLPASTTEWLHSMNLPAASDIEELRAEIQALRDDVRALTAALGPKAKPAARPKPKPKPKPRPKAE